MTDARATPVAIRQMVNNREIGGECHDRVLTDVLTRMGLTPVEAAVAIEEAMIAGYIKPGFWDRRNWAPAYPERTRGVAS